MPDQPLQRRLLDAIERGETVEVGQLISAGADVNLRGNDPDSETLLIHAVKAGNVSVVRALIEAGADVKCAAKLSGWTPLMFALESVDVLRELIVAGADVNARSAVQETHSPLARARIRRGGETALHLAAAANNAEAIRILTQAGANVEAVDETGRGPLDVALKTGSPNDAALALVEAGAQMTPERLEAIHSGAYRPESTLRFFPNVDEIAFKRVTVETPSHSVIPKTAATSTEESECPLCGALLYSRKTRVCAKCGASIPTALRVDEDQSRKVERDWANAVADRVGGLPWRMDFGTKAALRFVRTFFTTNLLVATSILAIYFLYCVVAGFSISEYFLQWGRRSLDDMGEVGGFELPVWLFIVTIQSIIVTTFLVGHFTERKKETPGRWFGGVFGFCFVLGLLTGHHESPTATVSELDSIVALYLWISNLAFAIFGSNDD